MFKISTTLDKLSEPPLPVTGTLCRYWSALTGSLNTWGLWIGLGKCILTCDESSLASKHTEEKTGLCLAFLFHFFPNLHICWSGELPPLHLLLQGRSDSEGPGEKSLSHCQKLFVKRRSKVQSRDATVASPAGRTPVFVYSSAGVRRWSTTAQMSQGGCVGVLKSLPL